MSIFHDWTPKEMAALRRATAKLRAQQPRDEWTKPDIQGCYYVPTRGFYEVHTFVNKERFYCGSMREWDEDKAIRMQQDKLAELRHSRKDSNEI